MKNMSYLVLFMLGATLHAQQPKLISLLPLTKFGYHESLRDSLSNPRSLTVSLTGDIYIADTGNNRIVKYSLSGEYGGHMGGYGWHSSQFDYPIDIFTRDGLNIYVADHNNRRVERLTKFLTWVSSLGEQGLGDLSRSTDINANQTMGYPAGVALSSQGDLFVVDSENQLVHKFGKFNTVIREPKIVFGDRNAGSGRLAAPTRIVVSNRHVFVADALRVVVFDYFGGYVRSLGGGVFKDVNDLCLDSQDRLLILDQKRVWILSSGGRIEGVSEMLPFRPVAIESYKSRVILLDHAGMVRVFELVE